MTTLTMPALKFITASFGIEYNTAVFVSPFTKNTQTLEFQGARWTASYGVMPYARDEFNDDIRAEIGKWKAFLASLRGMAGEFYAFDTPCSYCSSIGNVATSLEHTVAAIAGVSEFYPAASLYPATDRYPEAQAFDEFKFTLMMAVESVTYGGTGSGTTGAICGAVDFALSGTNVWDFSRGVNPGYQNEYVDALGEFDLESLYDDPVCIGAYIMVGNEYKIITGVSNYAVGDSVDCKATFCIDITFEPPMRASGTGDISFDNPKVKMRLIDDSQAQWAANAMTNEVNMQFSAVEVF